MVFELRDRVTLDSDLRKALSITEGLKLVLGKHKVICWIPGATPRLKCDN